MPRMRTHPNVTQVDGPMARADDPARNVLCGQIGSRRAVLGEQPGPATSRGSLLPERQVMAADIRRSSTFHPKSLGAPAPTVRRERLPGDGRGLRRWSLSGKTVRSHRSRTNQTRGPSGLSTADSARVPPSKNPIKNPRENAALAASSAAKRASGSCRTRARAVSMVGRALLTVRLLSCPSPNVLRMLAGRLPGCVLSRRHGFESLTDPERIVNRAGTLLRASRPSD